MNTDVKPAQLRLVNGSDVIVIRPRQLGGDDPIMCKSWDLGAPEVRYTSAPNPGADGVTESGGYLGSRTVQLELQILGGMDPETKQVHDAYWYAQKLTQMAHPRSAPILEISRDDNMWWRMPLRGDPWTMPFTQRSAALIDLTLTFVCPTGLIEGALLAVETPASGGGSTEMAFPMQLPFTFGFTGDTYPQVTFTVGGDSPVSPVLYITGPVVDPEVSCGVDPEVSCGVDRFRFDGLTLAAGELVQVDMATGDIRLGRADSRQVVDDLSAYSTVDWSVSSFWVWQPGQYTLRLYSTTGKAYLQYRERRLNI